MKTILTLGLALASLTTYSQSQNRASHKDLGLGYSSFPETSLPNREGAASPRVLLDIGSRHKAMVRDFAQRFPGQESVVLTPSLLDTLAATRIKTAGVHLFLGSKSGELQVIMTHTRIDTLKVNKTFSNEKNAVTYDSASNYNIVYDRAYYWDNQGRNWQIVEDEGTLDQDVLASRKRAQEQYGYSIQGYYLSKDLLLRIRKESGQDSLTIFLGQDDNIFHLILPILKKMPLASPVFHYATDYEKTLFSYHKSNLPPFKTNLYHYEISDSNHTASLSQNISSLPQNRISSISLAPPPPKDHNTVRPCQPYCGN